MKTTFILKLIAVLLFFLSIVGCTEPYQMQTNTFEETLVVEATITNALKKQQIKISRAYPLEENAPTMETGAEVHIIDDMGNQYDFIEQNGVYESSVVFQAIPNVNYQLFITTQEGQQYRSGIQKLTTINEITTVDTDVIVKDDQRGVQISVNSYDPTNTSKFYRYEYEETYKVISPKWSNYNAVIIGQNQNIVSFVMRDYESKTCYTTLKSTDLILTSTSNLTEDRIDKFPIRFIGDQDYIISERYSILVRQYILSREAYTYYETLNALADSGGILSPNQPGFINGNIKSVTNPKEKIIGFFNISSVSEKRIFFDYADIFLTDQKPPFFIECPEEALHAGDFSINPPGEGFTLIRYIQTGEKVFYTFIHNPQQETNPVYIMVPAPCGDCTSFSSNIVPTFWQ